MVRRCGVWAVLLFSTLFGAACREPVQSQSVEGTLVVRPGALDFERVALYDGKELTFALENAGRGTVSVSAISLEGPERTYALETLGGDDCVRSFGVGDRCDVKLHFSPLDPGTLPAKLIIESDSVGAERIEIPIKGVGVDARAVMPEELLDFGRIELQSEKRLTLPFRNGSPLPVRIINEPLGLDRGEFTTESFELQPGEARNVEVVFRPVSVGTKRAGLAVSMCGNCPPTVLPVRAVGLEQAVVAEPPIFDLGQVPVDREITKMMRLRNVSTEPMTLTGLDLGVDPEPAFTIQRHSFPITLPAFTTVEFPVRFVPTRMGPAEALASIAVESPRHPFTRVTIKAYGGTAELCVSPLNHDFGSSPVGSRMPLAVTVRNCGASNSPPLVVTGADLQGTDAGGDQYSFRNPGFPQSLAAGQELILMTFFEPNRVGAGSAMLNIDTELLDAPRVTIRMTGTAVQLPPCELTVTPGSVDFGTVFPGEGGVLGVNLRNDGTEICAVKNIRVTQSSGGVFSLPGGDIEGWLIEPGWGFTFMVAARPPVPGGSFVGTLSVENANPDDPVITIPLAVNSQTSCLRVAPTFVDFGFSRPDCPPGPRTVTLTNACTGAVNIRGASVGPGTARNEFAITEQPSWPLRLESGQTANIVVDFLAQLQGVNISPLFIEAEDLRRPLLVSLIGESHVNGQQLDSFTQQDGRKVDVLFVIDNTGSMVEEQPQLINALPAFLQTARDRAVDLQVAVTTTGIRGSVPSCGGGAQGAEAGRLFPVDNSRERILTLGTSNVEALLQANASVGVCAGAQESILEEGLEAMRRALSDPLVSNADDPRTPLPNDGNAGFLRPSAGLAVVFVSDEDDHSPDSVKTYVDFLSSIKGKNQPQRATIHAISPDAVACPTAGGSGTRYKDAALATGGTYTSICAPDFGPALQAIARRSFFPQTRFPLSAYPDTARIRVFIGGIEAVDGWEYSAADNSIVLTTEPTPGTRIDVRYRKRCE